MSRIGKPFVIKSSPKNGESRARGVAYISEWLDLKVVTGRYAAGFARELADHFENRSLNVFAVFDKIGHLEGAPFSKPTPTKPAAPLKGKLLRGLWHKHYVQGSLQSLALNLLNHWTDERLRGLVHSVSDAGLSESDAARYLNHKVAIGGHEQRCTLHEMTGEWIVFAKQDDVNYYLTLGVHGDDPAIAERVRKCAAEFPHLDILRRGSLGARM